MKGTVGNRWAAIRIVHPPTFAVEVRCVFSEGAVHDRRGAVLIVHPTAPAAVAGFTIANGKAV